MTRALGEAWLGRLLLLLSAYSPAAVIVGLRTIPSLGGWLAVSAGVVGFFAWTLALMALPRLGTRETSVSAVQPADPEITAYIATYLFPVLAATAPTAGEIGGYIVCAALILLVAYAADLGVANPMLYVLGFRVSRGVVDGTIRLVIARGVPRTGDAVRVVRGIGLVLVLETEEAIGA